MSVDKSLNVLVVEDNVNLRKVLINIINKLGFPPALEAEHGQEAWEKVQNEKVDIVLTDWTMPVMDGLELVKKIRGADKPIRDLPVLMITAMDTKDSVIAAGRQGVDAYIIKPFNVQTILQKIEEAVERRSAGAS